MQPRSAIIFATVVDGTTEFPRTAFTAIQTADGPEGGVGIGAGVGGTGLDGICVVFADVVIVVLTDIDAAFVEFVE